MRVYIASAMTGYPQFNWPAFFEAEAILEALGHEVRNPARMGHIEGGSWSDYLKRDLRNVLEVDAVCVLPGWDTSKGARLEVHVALELGLRVLPLSVWRTGIDERFVAGQHDGSQSTGLEGFVPPAAEPVMHAHSITITRGEVCPSDVTGCTYPNPESYYRGAV